MFKRTKKEILAWKKGKEAENKFKEENPTFEDVKKENTYHGKFNAFLNFLRSTYKLKEEEIEFLVTVVLYLEDESYDEGCYSCEQGDDL